MSTLIVIGTRPEAIKLAPVILELRSRLGHDAVGVLLSGQHPSAAKDVLEVFGIAPDHEFERPHGPQSLTAGFSHALLVTATLISRGTFRRLVVQGDTTTAAAAALAAFYSGVELFHVEAGLRSYDIARPFPEEAHRRFIALLAATHFAPTQLAADRLIREGVSIHRIFVTGNTVIDALTIVQDRLRSGEIRSNSSRRPSLKWSSCPYAIITCHRRESWGRAFMDICAAIRLLPALAPDFTFIVVRPPNPSVAERLEKEFGESERFTLCGPVRYDDFVQLLSGASVVLTDSGGIQEEAAALGKPLVVLRSQTERPEALLYPEWQLAGTTSSRITAAFLKALDLAASSTETSRRSAAFGDGSASKRIVEVMSLGAVAGTGVFNGANLRGEASP